MVRSMLSIESTNRTSKVWLTTQIWRSMLGAHHVQDRHKQVHPLLAKQCRQIYCTLNLWVDVWSKLQCVHPAQVVEEFPLLSPPGKHQVLETPNLTS